MSESLIATGCPRTSPGTQLSGTSCSDLSDETRHSQLRRKHMAYEEARTLQAGPERCAHATPGSDRGQVSEQVRAGRDRKPSVPADTATWPAAVMGRPATERELGRVAAHLTQREIHVLAALSEPAPSLQAPGAAP